MNQNTSGLIQLYIERTKAFLATMPSIYKDALIKELKKLIGKTVIILPTSNTSPEKGFKLFLKKVLTEDDCQDENFSINDFYGGPLCVLVNERDGKVSLFSHHEIIELQ